MRTPLWVHVVGIIAAWCFDLLDLLTRSGRAAKPTLRPTPDGAYTRQVLAHLNNAYADSTPFARARVPGSKVVYLFDVPLTEAEYERLRLAVLTEGYGEGGPL